MSLLVVDNLSKTFYDGEGNVAAQISVPWLQLERGEMLVLEGASGSGKTTFLHLLSGLLKEDEGSIIFDGELVHKLSAEERAAWRGANIGYVFQKLNLLDALTVEENVLLAARWRDWAADVEELQVRARTLLQQVGLIDKLHLYSHRLSLGEQQRVAIVRALFNKPRLLLTDEPTASLDRENTDRVLTLLQDMCRQNNTALILSTHDEYIKQQFPNRYDIRTGVRYE